MSWVWSPESVENRRSNRDPRGDKVEPDPTLYLGNTMVDPIFDFQFRFILIGDSAVGKSSLLRKFTLGNFAELSDPTVGVDFFARLVRVEDRTTIKLQLWDTAGQERFRSITKAYYRNSVGVLLVYDVTDKNSFDNLSQWMSEAKKHIEPHQATFALVGCKQDKSDMRKVSDEDVRSFAIQNNMQSFETSAKEGYRVEAAFQHLAQTIYDKIKTGEYKIEDGWDGIKRSYFGSTRYTYGTEESAITQPSLSPLVHGEAVQRHNCC